MNIKQALSEARHIIAKQNIYSTPSLDVTLLLCHTLKCTKEKVIFSPELNLTKQEEQDFFDLVEKRANRQPIAQILGYKEFFGENFFVNKFTLIPRPDSETLIELVLEKFCDKNKELKILEIGSGSGCLIITLLKLYKNSKALAIDISPEAYDITKKNANYHNVENRLKLLISNLFEKIENEKFDLIISNPPYIVRSEIENLQEEVKYHEPLLALDGGVDGLDFYRQIALNARDFLEKNGTIILEIGLNQEKEVIEIFNKNNFIFNGQKADLSGIIRVLSFTC